jgi:hypothetical protein
MALDEITLFFIPVPSHRPGHWLWAMSFLSANCSYPFVPRRRGCFSPHSVTGLLAQHSEAYPVDTRSTAQGASPVGFVSDCSSRPFSNKTPKTMPKMKKTIKQSAERASSTHTCTPRHLRPGQVCAGASVSHVRARGAPPSVAKGAIGARMTTGPPSTSPKQL